MDSFPGLPQQNRRLAAIMFLDMVGYSAMMSKDEARALACVGELEKLLRAEIPRFGGRLVKFLGDGSMAEFPTALAAVSCSQSVLASIEANNAWVAPENRYAVRIGLHLGELVDVQDDIFSDTVNVAARVQPLAQPGGIALSSFIYSQVKNQLNLKGTYLPPQKLKNIPEKMRIFLVHPGRTESPLDASTDHKKLAIRVAVGVVLVLLLAWLGHLLLRR
jgi:class 3 adenylate cyclase